MGTNIEDYLMEAYRTLKLDGHLHIIEATSRLKNLEEFLEQLENICFGIVFCKEMWKFTHIYAVKTKRESKQVQRIKL